MIRIKKKMFLLLFIGSFMIPMGLINLNNTNTSVLPAGADYTTISINSKAGGVYSGATKHVTSLQFTMTIPDDTPTSNDNFWIGISAWDSGTTYDQIGFKTCDTGNSCSASENVWRIAYEVNTNCNQAGEGDVGSILTPNATYTFQMNIDSNTHQLTYSVYEGTTSSGTPFWSNSPNENSPGSYFYEDSTYTCSSGTTYAGTSGGFTVYEEFLDTPMDTPKLIPSSWRFLFDKIADNNGLVEGMSNFVHTSLITTTDNKLPLPTTSTVENNNILDTISIMTNKGTYYDNGLSSSSHVAPNGDVWIANEPMSIWASNAPGIVSMQAGNPGSIVLEIAENWWELDMQTTTITFSTYTLPLGWTVTFSSATVDIATTSSILVNISPPSTAAAGAYTVGINATMTDSTFGTQFTTASIPISLSVPSSGGSGGGGSNGCTNGCWQ